MVIAMAKKKHLTNEQRSQIEHMLRGRESLKEIALMLAKSTSTISREIRKHVVSSNKSAVRRIRNRCFYRKGCTKFYLCVDKPTVKKDELLAERLLYTCLINGLSIKLSAGNCVPWHPPLIVTQEQLVLAFSVFEKAIQECTGQTSTHRAEHLILISLKK